MGNKTEWIFKFSKLIVGIVITFFPFNFVTPYKEIISGLGVIIIITAGLKIEFHSDSKPIVKPD